MNGLRNIPYDFTHMWNLRNKQKITKGKKRERGRERKILYDFTHMWNLRNKQKKQRKKKERQRETNQETDPNYRETNQRNGYLRGGG